MDFISWNTQKLHLNSFEFLHTDKIIDTINPHGINQLIVTIHFSYRPKIGEQIYLFYAHFDNPNLIFAWYFSVLIFLQFEQWLVYHYLKCKWQWHLYHLELFLQTPLLSAKSLSYWLWNMLIYKLLWISTPWTLGLLRSWWTRHHLTQKFLNLD